MKRKVIEVTVYSDSNIRVYDEMEVRVDDRGEELLSADQVDYLEHFHNIIQLLSRYTVEDFLEVTEPLIVSCSSQLGWGSEEVSSKLAPRFYRSTPGVRAVA